MQKVFLRISLFFFLFSCAQSGNETQTLSAPSTDVTFENPDIGNDEALADSMERLVSQFEREVWQKPNMVIRRMGDLRNMTVADIGAGYGYFAFRLLPVTGKVIAIDIDTAAIGFMKDLQEQLPTELRERFEARLCPPDDPNLKPEEADLAIMVDTYVYLNDRITYLKKLRSGMTPQGRLLIIDFKDEPTPIGPPRSMRLPVREVEEELWQAGFRQIQVDLNSLEYQYILMATAR